MGWIESTDIMQAVEAALNRAFPGEPVYWDSLPRGFQRPCSALELQKTDMTAAAAGLVWREESFLVTCLEAVDAHGDSSRERLTRRQSRVAALFSAGSFPVMDRHLTVKAVRGEQSPELAEVTLLFSWMDARPDCGDAEEAGVEAMRNFAINGTEIPGKDG